MCARGLFFAMLLAACGGPVWGQTVVPVLNALSLDAPECVSPSPGQVECLALRRDGALARVTYAKGRWSRPESLGGALAGPPSCVVRGPGGLNCFAVRRDRTLGHLAMNGGRWGTWRSLGGSLAPGRPSCVATQRDRIVCHVRWRNNTLAVKVWNGDPMWQPWRAAGGALGSDPSCVALSLDRTACFWRRSGDDAFSAWLPRRSGPGEAVLTLPQTTGTPSCASLGGDRVSCLANVLGGELLEWRGSPFLGAVGRDGFRVAAGDAGGDPSCAAWRGETVCAYVNSYAQLVRMAATPDAWGAPATLSETLVATGRCATIDRGHSVCLTINAKGEMRAVFQGSPPSAALPAPLSPSPSPPAPPDGSAGDWYVFEPRSGLHCRLTLTGDGEALPRRVARDRACDDLSSIDAAVRWSVEDGDGVALRTRRGRLLFLFQRQTGEVWRAPWRRRDSVLLARDLRAFASPEAGLKASATGPIAGEGRAYVGVWRVRGPGQSGCRMRLRIDPESAATLAAADGCSGALANADRWAVEGGAIVFYRGAAKAASFREGRGAAWNADASSGVRGLWMIKQ